MCRYPKVRFGYFVSVHPVLSLTSYLSQKTHHSEVFILLRFLLYRSLCLHENLAVMPSFPWKPPSVLQILLHAQSLFRTERKPKPIFYNSFCLSKDSLEKPLYPSADPSVYSYHPFPAPSSRHLPVFWISAFPPQMNLMKFSACFADDFLF